MVWEAVAQVCRHRRKWDTEPAYMTKCTAGGSRRALPGFGKVHGGAWEPSSVADTPEAHGRLVDVDTKSLALCAAADVMESWPRQTATISRDAIQFLDLDALPGYATGRRVCRLHCSIMTCFIP